MNESMITITRSLIKRGYVYIVFYLIIKEAEIKKSYGVMRMQLSGSHTRRRVWRSGLDLHLPKDLFDW